MKLASLKSGRDGRLVVVSRDLKRYIEVSSIAATLQLAVENWDKVKPQLQAVYDQLNANSSNGNPFAASAAASPLPRAYQWMDGSAYVNHVELVRKTRGVDMPASFWTDPLVYQGGSDDFIGPCDDAFFASEEWGIDIEAEVAIITGDIPMGSNAEQASQRGDIKLLMLVNDWSLRNLIVTELAKGFGFYQSKPATAFSPVCVTPDELGTAWDGGKINLPLHSYINGERLGAPHAGTDMTFNFLQLIAHATKTRNVRAGSIIGSGTVSNYDRSRGSSCLAEKRTLETAASGKPVTPFLKFGDKVRIEMLDESGNSIFGAIEQQVVRAP